MSNSRMTAQGAALAFCDAWSRLDAPAIPALFTESGVYIDPLMPSGRSTGRQQIGDAVSEGMSPLTDCRVELVRLVEDGSVAMAEGHFHAGLPDGTALDFDFALVVEVVDGLIARLAEYFDTKLPEADRQ